LSLHPASQGVLIRHCQITYFGDLLGNIKSVRKINNLPALLHDVSQAFFCYSNQPLLVLEKSEISRK